MSGEDAAEQQAELQKATGGERESSPEGGTQPSKASSPPRSTSPPAKGSTSPKAAPVAKAAKQRLTLEEAADEIRRLRRVAHQLRADLAASAAAKEQSDAQHEREAEKAKEEAAAAEAKWKERNGALEARIHELEEKVAAAEKQAQDAEEQVQYIQASSLPLTDARKLTYKALRKGRALQCLATLVTQNSFTNRMLREGFTALLENAFGATHVAFRMQQQRLPCGISGAAAAGAVAAATDQQLRLFRQEQLLLLAENERLTEQVKRLQEEMTAAAQILTPRSSAEVSLGSALWRSQAPIRPGTPGAPAAASPTFAAASAAYFSADDWRRVRAIGRRAPGAGLQLATGFQSMALELLPTVIHSARKRLLSWALRKLYDYGLYTAEQLRFEAAERRERLARDRQTFAIGLRFISFAVRFSMQRRVHGALWRLILHSCCAALEQRAAAAVQAAAAAAAKKTRSVGGRREELQQQICPQCMRRGFFAASAGGGGGAAAGGEEATSGPFLRFPLPAPAAGGGAAGLPFYVCQPYYYKTLPSMQRRNLYFAAPPPPLQQENLRQQALRQPMFRPEPEATGVPARTFGAVEAESALSNRFIPHATFDAELQRRNQALQGVLRSQALPSSNTPLSAAQVNDMYIDMLLDEVNRSAPL